MVKVWSVFLLVLLYFVIYESQGINVNDKYEYWNKEAATKLPIGSNKDIVKRFLVTHQLDHSFVAEENKFYAIDKDVTNWRIIYKAAILIRVQLDNGDKVLSIELERSFSGL